MDTAGRLHWDERYAAGAAAFGDGPDPFLAAQAAAFPPGAAILLPGDGEGRNGVWLARAGHDVTNVDISAIGVAQAQARAAAAGVAVRTIVADLTEWTWPQAGYDVVVAIFFHMPEPFRPIIHAGMLGAVRPGGLVVLRAFTPAHLDVKAAGRGRGGPPDASLLYDSAMLRRDFAGAIVEHLVEHEVTLPEARLHGGQGAVIEGRFRRPG